MSMKFDLTAKAFVARALFVALLVVSAAVAAISQQRLLVVGGGARPPEAMKKFVEWSGGAQAKILVITWATAAPDESFEALRKNFAETGASTIVHAATRPLDGAKRPLFVEQLAAASAVFFSGGDQNRIMDVLADEELLKLLRAKYRAGAPFGGTSAGAAVMSDPMMTGEADLKIVDGTKVGVRKGLGLIANVIFDQHFLVRQRHNRLLGLISKDPKMLGIGIDEDTAVLVEDDRRLKVVGQTFVMLIDGKKGDGSFAVYLAKPGDIFDLKKRKPIR